MFSELLRDLRAEKRLSQKKLAEIIDVSPGNVSDWESGKAKPGYVALTALSRCFEVSADYLLELEPEKSGECGETQHLEEIKKNQGLLCDGSPLTDEEADLVAMYRLLPLYAREDMFDQVHCLYRKYAERKKESIYWTYKEDSEGKSGTATGDKTRSGTA